ncbi:hypothetical protein Ctob_005261 [Chrysochromulina tobinii]|uniref:Uncharacterized protein n=1 Tax=Chrysochromulina tobinii TaxID=1460289 RepID=A0A0M0JED3_9EUKA|nr:hypothetical protein Ctob_005261 [Chrysochromulina tobinii]|eukprot:KOO24593.1 hypothetical protein Ctob_005261 [Chrysochromulina sp. CCMP291]
MYAELIVGGLVRVWWTKTMAGHLERFQYGTVTVVGPASLPQRKRDPLNCTFEVTYPDQPCGAEGGKFLHDLEQPKPPEPPHEGSLRYDIFRALCDGHSTRAAIIDYVDQHGI